MGGLATHPGLSLHHQCQTSFPLVLSPSASIPLTFDNKHLLVLKTIGVPFRSVPLLREYTAQRHSAPLHPRWFTVQEILMKPLLESGGFEGMTPSPINCCSCMERRCYCIDPSR